MSQLIGTSSNDLKRFGKNGISITTTLLSNALLDQVASKYVSAIERSSDAWDRDTIREIESLREARDELVIVRQALTWQKVRN